MIGAVVDAVLKKIENAADEGMKAADDYKDTETGLLMCRKCHTRKQNIKCQDLMYKKYDIKMYN